MNKLTSKIKKKKKLLFPTIFKSCMRDNINKKINNSSESKNQFKKKRNKLLFIGLKE